MRFFKLSKLPPNGILYPARPYLLNLFKYHQSTSGERDGRGAHLIHITTNGLNPTSKKKIQVKMMWNVIKEQISQSILRRKKKKWSPFLLRPESEHRCE